MKLTNMNAIVYSLLSLVVSGPATYAAPGGDEVVATTTSPGADVALTPPPPFPIPKDRVLDPGGRALLIGPYAGINYAMHDGSFVITQNGITCCEFNGGQGIGIVAGAKAYIPLTDDISLSPRLLYDSRPGKFTVEGEPFPILGANNEIELLQYEDQLDVSYSMLSVDVLGTLTLTPFGLYIAAGPTAGIVLTKSFVKTETLTAPSGVTYKDKTTTKEFAEGEIADINTVQIGLRGGLGANIPVADGIFLNPEVLYSLALTKVNKIDNWKAHALQATLGVVFEF